MHRTADELLAEALELPEKARAQLAQSLLTSLGDAEEGESPETLEQAWLAEISRRASELEAGTVRPIPAGEVFRSAREELQSLRARRVRGT